jgi:flagellar biosynthesis GTPase FlhF
MGSGKKKRDWAEGNPEEDFWELNKLPEILERIDKDKEEMRAAAAVREEEQRREQNRSRWAIKATELNNKEKELGKEKEKEKEKENKNAGETEAERKFRLASERSLGRQEWRQQINRLMTGRPEPKVRFDATDSPLSSNMEEGELDYLPQPGQPGEEDEEAEESEADNNY